ncbi:MAG: hypothetical protein V1915_00540 [Candidatus Bathyarchaeota archaeon]
MLNLRHVQRKSICLRLGLWKKSFAVSKDLVDLKIVYCDTCGAILGTTYHGGPKSVAEQLERERRADAKIDLTN